MPDGGGAACLQSENLVCSQDFSTTPSQSKQYRWWHTLDVCLTMILCCFGVDVRSVWTMGGCWGGSSRRLARLAQVPPRSTISSTPSPPTSSSTITLTINLPAICASVLPAQCAIPQAGVIAVRFIAWRSTFGLDAGPSTHQQPSPSKADSVASSVHDPPSCKAMGGLRENTQVLSCLFHLV